MARRRLARLVPFVGAAVALAACNAITGLSDDYHLAGDGGPSTPTETGTPGEAGGDNDVSMNEGGTETSMPDGGPDSTVPFCKRIDAQDASALDFSWCNELDDADGGDLARFTSFSAVANGTGSLAVVAGAGFSGAGGLVIDLDRQEGGGGSQLWAQINLPNTGGTDTFARYDVSFQLKIETNPIGPTGPDYVIFGLLTFENDATGSADHGVALHSINALKHTKVDNMDPGGGVSENVYKNWTAISLTLERMSGSLYKRKMLIGSAVQPETVVTLQSNWQPAVRIGAFYTSSTKGKLRAYVDELLVQRTKP